MERGETLRDLLVSYSLRKKSLPPLLIRHFWFQMVQAIDYMHRINIVHGDCKPENFIQVGPDRRTLRLIDMGISFQLPDNVTSHLKTMTGTPGKLLIDKFLHKYLFLFF
jgi:serine/threonine-protein kinase TTK/MPS1